MDDFDKKGGSIYNVEFTVHHLGDACHREKNAISNGYM